MHPRPERVIVPSGRRRAPRRACALAAYVLVAAGTALSQESIPADTASRAALHAAVAGTASPDTAVAGDRLVPWRLGVIGAAAAGTMAATYIYMQNTWWKDGNTRFHFDKGADLRYALNLDKFAHAYGGAIASDMFSRGLRWAGFDRTQAAWYGFGLSVFVQMVIEVKDGFSPRWGYSVWDVTAGTTGALFTTLKTHSDFLDAIDMKFSYWRRSDKYFTRIKTDGTGTWNDDYINQTYWLSFKMDRLLPAGAARWWPDWLALAAGMGVDDKLAGYDVDHPDRRGGNIELYLALDVDVTKILPSDNGPWETIKHYLNFVKFPAPAIRITPGVIWYGLYF